MKIKKEKVKQLIMEFQRSFNAEIFKQIVVEMSDMVYNYPLVVFHMGPEDCSGFYIYFIERSRSLILKYNPALSSFYTWFNIVLKSQCLNWLNSLQSKKRKKIRTESLDNSLSYLTPGERDKPAENGKDNISLSINKYIDNLSKLDHLIIKLLYYDIDTILLNKISSYNKKTKNENIELIKQLLNNNKKFSIQSGSNSKIAVFQYKILEIKKRSVLAGEGEKKRLFKRLKRYSSNLKFLKNKLDHNLENFDIQSIAIILNENRNEIYYRMRKIKQGLFLKLKNKIKTKNFIFDDKPVKINYKPGIRN